MAKTLEFTINSPRQIKQGDTETTFTFICKSAGSAVELTHATNITAKIGNASGYLRSQPIAITSLVGLSQGWLNLQPMPDLISGLPAGDYRLEIWVVDQEGTSIYPSDKPLGFTITNNIESESGASITTIAFDDFVQAMNKAASTIAKGDPGEGLDIKGQVTSVSALPSTANEGDGYLVNEELYVYTSGEWKDCGTIQGPQGIQGKTGTGISSTTIQYQISNSATTAPTGTWSNDIVATTTANPYLWMKATLNYTDNTTKDFYLISQKGDKGDKGDNGPQGVKGDKGDTGTVDNAGLTTAPAFVNLQTQVNNSAVGTNLFSQSTATAGYINAAYGTVDSALASSNEIVSDYISVSASSNYTFQMWGTTPSGQNYWYGIGQYDSDKKFILRSAGIGSTQPTNTTEHMSQTITTASTTAYMRVSFRKYDDFKAKLEKGSVATDWCPNSSEILTQSDYAKIKAAIVALGGSLS